MLMDENTEVNYTCRRTTNLRLMQSDLSDPEVPSLHTNIIEHFTNHWRTLSTEKRSFDVELLADVMISDKSSLIQHSRTLLSYAP